MINNVQFTTYHLFLGALVARGTATSSPEYPISTVHSALPLLVALPLFVGAEVNSVLLQIPG